MIPSARSPRVKLVLAAFAALAALCLWFGTLSPARQSADRDRALGPLSRYALPASKRLRFEGRVIERVRANSYMYLQVERAGGERTWVVTLASSAGARSSTERVTVLALGYAERFSSKQLARTFDGLYFAVVRPS